MKVLPVVYTALFAAVTLNAGAQVTSQTPSVEPDFAELQAFCNQPGQPCHKVKRAANAAADALAVAEAEAYHNPKAKRAAEALAEAIANAYAAVEPDPEARNNFCWRPGQSCGKMVKRDAGMKVKRNAEADASPEARNWFCWRRGQSCGKAKRTAEDLEAAAKEALASLE